MSAAMPLAFCMFSWLDLASIVARKEEMGRCYERRKGFILFPARGICVRDCSQRESGSRPIDMRMCLDLRGGMDGWLVYRISPPVAFSILISLFVSACVAW
ncbi:hypothetical protein CCHR01_07846 [Colletotrichum chrysophilum]|uniref:Secreted protein n=1 Tax=Colletotrichum chrysophilum TaxID=1836956 RepID=A0AAD9EIG2_9PEZI|nr:hypothetical protein CCHR01_07846 [Colletotrichum chrysophilum]